MSKKELLPLVLSVKASNWRMNDDNSENADADFSRVRKKALERDDYSCRFCGFRSHTWQEVHHYDDNHANNDLKNLITTCSFCHLCQHVGFAGIRREAVLAWIPELSQAQLHHIIRSIMVVKRWAENEQSPRRPGSGNNAKAAQNMADSARALESKLRSREADAEIKFGTSDPTELANVLQQMDQPLYDKRNDFLNGLRLLPLGVRVEGGIDKMPGRVDGWLSSGPPNAGPYCSLPPRNWVSILRQYSN